MKTINRDFSEKGRHLLYMVLDCETATLPFANEIAMTAEQKKNIAIARPLIYDIGWKIVDSDGNIYDRKSFLITEIFSVPSVFNTAYYKKKRPIYLERLKKGETILKSWGEVVAEFQPVLEQVNYVSAFNAMFDFKKAIPFTELYISKLYSPDYQDWENMQRLACQKIAREKSGGSSGREFDSEHFCFRGKKFPIIDIWGVACESLINTDKYRIQCLENEMITASGKFFKTSAESTYRYVLQDFTFDEAHTAIDDVDIEEIILRKALKKGKVTKGIIYFPFQLLGTTDTFLRSSKKVKKEHFDIVIEVIKAKLNEYTSNSSFATQLQSTMWTLEFLRDNRF